MTIPRLVLSMLFAMLGLGAVLGLFFFGMMFGPLGFAISTFAAVGLAFALILAAVFIPERMAAQKLEREGIECRAQVKTFRRISMTQHRVLLLIHFPTGPIGRELVISGLSDDWLADVCALEKPVRVKALPDSITARIL